MSTACRCESCSSKPLKSYGEDYRHETEVRYLASLPFKSDRKRYLSGVETQRGAGEKDRLIAGLHGIHRGRAR